MSQWCRRGRGDEINGVRVSVKVTNASYVTGAGALGKTTALSLSVGRFGGVGRDERSSICDLVVPTDVPNAVAQIASREKSKMSWSAMNG